MSGFERKDSTVRDARLDDWLRVEVIGARGRRGLIGLHDLSPQPAVINVPHKTRLILKNVPRHLSKSPTCWATFDVVPEGTTHEHFVEGFRIDGREERIAVHDAPGTIHILVHELPAA